MLDIQLNWSEYFQGAWTARETSGFSMGNAIELSKPFDASAVFLTVVKEADPEPGADGAVQIILNGILDQQVDDYIVGPEGSFSTSHPVTPYLRVVSKNNLPQRFSLDVVSNPTSPYNKYGKTYNRFTGSGPLSVTFVKQIVTTDGNEKANPPAPQPILSKGGGYTLLPSSNQMKFPNAEFAPLISPVFYADDVYTFFVEPSLTETTVDTWQGYTIPRPSQKSRWKDYMENPTYVSPQLPPKYLQKAFKQPKTVLQPDPIDPLALHAIKPNLDALTQPGVAVQFGDAIVGRTGRMQDLGTITQLITNVGGNSNLKI